MKRKLITWIVAAAVIGLTIYYWKTILHWILMLIAGLWVLRFLFRLACQLMPLIVAGYIIYTLFTK